MCGGIPPPLRCAHTACCALIHTALPFCIFPCARHPGHCHLATPSAHHTAPRHATPCHATPHARTSTAPADGATGSSKGGVRPPYMGTTPAPSQMRNTLHAARIYTHSPPVLQSPHARNPAHCHLLTAPSAHHTTPHHTTPHHTTPHHTTPHHTTPHHTTPHHTTPHHTTPHHTTPHATHRHPIPPHHATANCPRPHNTTPMNHLGVRAPWSSFMVWTRRNVCWLSHFHSFRNDPSSSRLSRALGSALAGHSEASEGLCLLEGTTHPEASGLSFTSRPAARGALGVKPCGTWLHEPSVEDV